MNAAGTLEIAERGATPGIDKALDGSVGMFRRVMDLRDVVHRRDTIVELAQAPEQIVDVNVLRTVHGREREQNVFVVRDVAARRVGTVVDQYPVGEKTAEHRLELMMVSIDESRHDDAAARVDRCGTARLQVRADGDDLLALDQHVGLGKIAYARIHRHHGTAANDVAPARLAAVARRVTIGLRGSRRRSQQIETRRSNYGRSRGLQEIT